MGIGMNLQELIENSFCLNSVLCIIGHKVGIIEDKKIGDQKNFNIWMPKIY